MSQVLANRAEAVASRFPALIVAARRVASTVVQGLHGRRQVGTGETFWQFRRYEAFDMMRRIDWRQSAKGANVFVRETEWEAAQSVWIWRDASPSMDYRSSRSLPTKQERADLLTLALAALLTDSGEAVAMLGTADRPRHGRFGFTHLTDLMMRQAESGSLPPPQPLPRHCDLVLIGDFLDPWEDWRGVVERYVGMGVRGHMFQITDPSEEAFPFAGRVRFVGPEREQPHLLRRADLVRGDYTERLAAHRAGLEDLARVSGWTFSRHVTDSTPESALLTLYAALARATP